MSISTHLFGANAFFPYIFLDETSYYKVKLNRRHINKCKHWLNFILNYIITFTLSSHLKTSYIYLRNWLPERTRMIVVAKHLFFFRTTLANNKKKCFGNEIKETGIEYLFHLRLDVFNVFWALLYSMRLYRNENSKCILIFAQFFCDRS